MNGKRGRPPKIKEESIINEKLIVDDYTEKPLSILISEIKSLLKSFRNEIDIKVSEKGGKVSEVQITARIQL